MAPTAPMMPIAAEACLVAGEQRRRPLGVPGVVARSASVRKIAGIILYVEPLPMPVKTKISRNMPRNQREHVDVGVDGRRPRRELERGRVGLDRASAAASAAAERLEQASVHSTPRVPAIMPPKATSVTRAPPNRSASQPPSGRAIEPTSGAEEREEGEVDADAERRPGSGCRQKLSLISSGIAAE